MRRLMGFVALATVAFVGSLAGPLAGTASADTGSDEASFVVRINELRASKGLSSLSVDGGLTQIARGWSQEMANAGSIWHNPDFKNLVTANWARLGENVGMGPEIGALFNAFVNSPGHYANLVDPSFTHIGVGVVYGGRQIFTSHQFMTLRGGSGGASSPPRAAPPATTAVTRPPAAPRPVVTVPRPVTTTTTTTIAPPPPPPPPPPPVLPERIRVAMETLRLFDPQR